MKDISQACTKPDFTQSIQKEAARQHDAGMSTCVVPVSAPPPPPPPESLTHLCCRINVTQRTVTGSDPTSLTLDRAHTGCTSEPLRTSWLHF